MKSKYALLILFLCTFILHSNAQVLYPDDYTSDYYDLLVFKNFDSSIRPISNHPSVITNYLRDDSIAWDIWEGKFKTKFKKNSKLNINWLDPQLGYLYNPYYSRGYNDGAIWNGKGSNLSFTTGFTGNYGILHFSFAPVVSYAENLQFFIPNIGYAKNEYSYPFENNIDWVQRYGGGSYYNFNLGQTEIRAIYKNFSIGFSTANTNWGPSKFNPILISNNAAGFPRIDIGSAIPAKTKIGFFDYQIFWGKLNESNYFDEDPTNDRRYITGMTIGYEPNFAKGLSLAVSRVMYTKWDEGDLSFVDLFALFTSKPNEPGLKNDEYDGLMSFMLRWAFPEVGFEAYLEYARNDFVANLNDIIEAPDRARARTIGFIKTFDLKNGNLMKLVYESTILSANQLQIVTPGGNPTYYVHSVVKNGYTQNGQLVGAGIGPGSNSDILRLYFYNPSGRLGFEMQRIRFNDDYFVNSVVLPTFDYPTDYEFSLAVDYVRFYKNFSIQPKILLGVRKNFYYQDDWEKFMYQIGLKTTYTIGR